MKSEYVRALKGDLHAPSLHVRQPCPDFTLGMAGLGLICVHAQPSPYGYISVRLKDGETNADGRYTWGEVR